MLAELSETIIATIGAFTAGLVAFGAYYKVRTKHQKDTYQILVESIDKLQKRYDSLEEEVKQLRVQLDELRDYKGKFSLSLDYIRELCHWIGTIPGIPLKGKPRMPRVLKEHYGDYELKEAHEGE